MYSLGEWVLLAVGMWGLILFMYTIVELNLNSSVWGKKEDITALAIVGFFTLLLVGVYVKHNGWVFGLKEGIILTIVAVEVGLTHVYIRKSNQKPNEEVATELVEHTEPRELPTTRIYIVFDPFVETIVMPRYIDEDGAEKVANSKKKLEDGELELISSAEQLAKYNYVYKYKNKKISTVVEG